MLNPYVEGDQHIKDAHVKGDKFLTHVKDVNSELGDTNFNGDVNDTLSVADEFYDVEIFKDANLHFDMSFPPMEKWT